MYIYIYVRSVLCTISFGTARSLGSREIRGKQREKESEKEKKKKSNTFEQYTNTQMPM